MLPDRVSNPGPLTYESGALPIALRGPAILKTFIMYWHGGHIGHVAHLYKFSFSFFYKLSYKIWFQIIKLLRRKNKF